MIQPNEPDPPDTPAGTHWYEATDAVQRALDTIPPLSVSRWLPRTPTDYQPVTGGPRLADESLYAQMRENQAQGLPAITREQLYAHTRGRIPLDELPPLPMDYQQQQDDVARLMAAGHSPEVLTGHLRAMGFHPVGTVAADGIRRVRDGLRDQTYETGPAGDSDDYAAHRRRNTEDVARVFGVPVELISGPTPDREGYVPGDGPSGDPVWDPPPVVGRGLRIIGYDREREMYHVEYIDDDQSAGADSNDPLTAMRTRSPVGQATVSVTPTSRDRLMDSRRDTTFRERMLAPRTVAPLEVGATPPPPPAPSREPNWVDPTFSVAAKRQMQETFADLQNMGRGELLDLITAMRRDWETLNDIHNRRANRSGWCTEYEERQGVHNQKLAVLKLLGRVVGGPKDEYEGRGL